MTATILIVDDEENALRNLSAFLSKKGYEIITATHLAEARTSLQRGEPDIVLLDVQLPDGYGPDLLEETVHIPDRPPIILITAYGEIEMAVEAMKNGAQDFLQKPIEFTRLEQSIQRAEEIVTMRRELNHLRQSQQGEFNFVVGKSPKMRRLVQVMQRASLASVSVLITGETGTGKEVMARAIHMGGPRAKKSFVAINCAAIQSTMLESELFGHVKGAFTGAVADKVGLFEVANGGTIFLDEIGELEPGVQAKINRVLQEHEIRPVGATEDRIVDARVIAATNQELEGRVREGRFREDLYHRLNVIGIHLPALRERREDIPALVRVFLDQSLPGVRMCTSTHRSLVCRHRR